MTKWNTKITELLRCRIPVVGAPMAGHSGGRLAAAVCRAGGMGFIGAGHWMAEGEAGLQQLETEVALLRDDSKYHPLCLGFIGHSTFRDASSWKRFEEVIETYQPDCVQFFAPTVVDSGRNISTVNGLCSKTKVVAQVGSVRDALVAVEAGADVIIAQGSEAGGHGLRRELGNGTLSLARNIISKVAPVPVLAAGGIVDGPTMAAALLLGCDGVVLGTRLWASEESIGKQVFKDRILAADSCDDVTRTTTFDWIQNTYHTTPWPDPYDSVGAIRNGTSRTWEGRESELRAALLENKGGVIDEFRRATAEGNVEIALVHAGEGAGLIDTIEPAEDIVLRITEDCATTIRRAAVSLLSDDDDTNEDSSEQHDYHYG